MSVVVADTSEFIEYFAGRPALMLREAIRAGAAVLPPIVIAELIAGAAGKPGSRGLAALLQSLPVHPTPPEHWIRAGLLRRTLRAKGVAISTPDAHVAQCALDMDATLLTRDTAFTHIARFTALRLHAVRNA